MSQIENSYFSKQALLPPLVFMGAAFLAGTRHAIQYFPGASKEGLLLAAGLASTTSYLYDSIVYDPDHSDIGTLIGKATAIAFATVCTRLAARPLKERAHITLGAAAKFAVVEFVVAAVISSATGESAMQKEHRQFNEKPYLWMKLSKEQRTEKALTFMKAGFPAFLITIDNPDNVDETQFPDPKTSEACEALTPSELSWTWMARNPKEPKTLIFLFKLALRKGIEPLRFDINANVISLLTEEQEMIERFYQDMFNNPQCFYVYDKEDQETIVRELFQGKEPIPPVDPKLTPQQITKMEGMLSWFWEECCMEHWEDVPIETRSAFVKRFWVMMDMVDKNIFEGVDTNWLAELSVEEIQELKDDPLKVCNKVMRMNREAVKKQLSVKQLAAFNKAFSDKWLEEIK